MPLQRWQHWVLIAYYTTHDSMLVSLCQQPSPSPAEWTLPTAMKSCSRIQQQAGSTQHVLFKPSNHSLGWNMFSFINGRLKGSLKDQTQQRVSIQTWKFAETFTVQLCLTTALSVTDQSAVIDFFFSLYICDDIYTPTSLAWMSHRSEESFWYDSQHPCNGSRPEQVTDWKTSFMSEG